MAREGEGLRGILVVVRRRLHLLWPSWHDPRVALTAMVAVFVTVFGTLASLRYWTFATYAWDLGIYNQASYTTLFSHQFFYYTADLPAGTQGSLFAVHFSPFLILLLPFYALAPSPVTLLVLQALGLGLAALPLFGLASTRLGSPRWGLLLAGLYLLSPVTQGIAWYDFHPEAFLPLTVLGAFYFLEKGRLLPFLGFWVLALSVVEEIAPFLALFAFLLLLPRLLPRPARPGSSPVSRKALASLPDRWVFGALVIAVLWIAVAYEALAHAGAVGGGAFGANYGVNWAVLGASSPLLVFPQALLHPDRALGALAFDAPQKATYLLLLFGPVALLPWAGEDRYLFPALAWVGFALLSNYPAYYALGDQYAAYALPFLAAGAIGGLAWSRPRLARWRASWRARHTPTPPRRSGARRPAGWWSRSLGRRLLRGDRPLAGMALAAVVASAALASPVLPSPAGGFQEITYGLPELSPHEAQLHRLVALIPASAAVLTTTTLFPEVSGRPHAYVLPTSSYFVGDSSFASALDGYVNASTFVLLDYRVDPYSAVILASFADLRGFGLRAAADGGYLYERGFTGAPTWVVPWATIDLLPGALAAGNAVLETSVGGSPLHHLPGAQNGTQMWAGLEPVLLPPGAYAVTLELRLRGTVGTPALLADLVQTPVTVNVTLVNPSPAGHDYGFTEIADGQLTAAVANVSVSPPGGNGWVNATLDASWGRAGILDCTGWIADPSAELWLYGVSIQQTSAVAGPG